MAMGSTLENAYTDIFTEPNDTIVSDGSIDPLGLRMIWTALGSRIFQNRLNTISTSIRLYTINLFHHALIQYLTEQYEERIFNLTGKPPYDNRNDLYDGIIIFLESLLDHVMAGLDADESAFPGVSKLRGILRNDPGSNTATLIPVDRKAGILVRHILLGIHGRHKGPFQQMQLLGKSDYYTDRVLWRQVQQLFTTKAWAELFNKLSEILEKHVREPNTRGGNPIRIKVVDLQVEMLVPLYSSAFLKPENFKTPALIQFWETRLGLADESATAGIIYQYIRQKRGETDYRLALKDLKHMYPQQADLQAIDAIEPLLTSVQNVMNRLLHRGVSELGTDIKTFIRFHLDNSNVRLEAISSFLNEEFFNEDARKRLQKLAVIWQACSAPDKEELFAHQLIDFHHEIMRQRNNAPWISISPAGSITQHRSYYFTESGLEGLKSYDWVNDYYVNTVISLYRGLYQ